MSLPGFDSHESRVIGVDTHLPPVPEQRLRAAALRQRFSSPPRWSPEVVAEQLVTETSPVCASVLIPLVLRDELSVLLTQRTSNLNQHPGQICFPGGRAEIGDLDAAATALREAQEEIGLAAGAAEVLGELPPYTTTTAFLIRPVVALIEPPFTLRANGAEVASVFEVPLAFLMNPAHHCHHSVGTGSSRREFLSMTWHAIDDAGRPSRHFIWGATAAMLRNLYRFLAA